MRLLIIKWYNSQNTLTQFLLNVCVFAFTYFVLYRLIIDIVPFLRDAKNELRDVHIDSILRCSQKLLHWFGVETGLDTVRHQLVTASNRWVRMTPLCSGVMITSVMAAFIISFPGRKLLFKLRIVAIGAVFIYVLNVVRVAVIAAQLASNNKSHIMFVQNYHKTVYDTLIYILVLVYIAVYVFKFSAQTLSEK